MNKNIYSKAMEHLKTSPDFISKTMSLLNSSAKVKKSWTQWSLITAAGIFLCTISIIAYTFLLKQPTDIVEPLSQETPLNTQKTAYIANKCIDYFFDDEMPWDSNKDFELPEFSDTVFRWSAYNVIAINSNGEKELYGGMPVWSIYLADLTGDGLPEICSTVSIGSGIIDERIIVYDYAAEKAYELSDRMYYNYNLFLDNGRLMVKQVKYSNPFNSDEFVVGELSIVDGNLTANGIEKVKYNTDELTDNKFYELTFNEMSYVQVNSPLNGNFWYSLTAEQVKLLFPIFSDFSNLKAIVNYNNNQLNDIAIYGRKNIESPEVGILNKNISVIIDFTGYSAEKLNDYQELIESDVFGVKVIASSNDKDDYHSAIFEIDGILYDISDYCSPDEFTQFINNFIQTINVDFDIFKNPVVPEIYNAKLTLEEAYEESALGKFIPHNIPERFNFQSADRFVDLTLTENSFIEIKDFDSKKTLNLFWDDGFYSVSCSVSEYMQSFDELSEHKDSIKFLPDDITITAIQEVLDRPVSFANIKDAEGNPVCGESLKSFYVLYDNILVNISLHGSGITAEEIFEMLILVR